MDRPPLQDFDVDAALRTILEGTATQTGTEFFQALVKNLAFALNTHGAWVTEYFPESRRLKALAFWMGDQWLDDWEMAVDGTACERVVDERCLVHIPDNLLDIYGDNPEVRAIGAASYLGMPLLDLGGKVLGHLAVLDLRPMPAEPRAQALFQIFAARAGAELRRLRAEAQVREREQKLGRLVGSAMDAIIELDRHLAVTQMNPAAEKVMGCGTAAIVGRTFSQFLSADSREKLARLIIDLDSRADGQRSLWIAGGLDAATESGLPFRAEATLSRFDIEREPFYTVIFRNVNDRLAAEQKIRSLTVEAEYLREEIKSLFGADEIVGQSEALLGVLRDVQGSRRHRCDGADSRRDRNRQRTHRAGDSSCEPAAAKTAHQSQLRGDSGNLDRERILRPRSRRVHRRDQKARRPIHLGQRRHDILGRDRRASVRLADETAPGAARRRIRAGRQLSDTQGRCAGIVCHKSRP